ncbi:uncharacterized protein LOC125062464 isoform X2 [Pieris napi]|uniref:uncharacterized protein LOC125062464 isoform X2 n=1 Tax=Pieris napi TaxID=78633 RepID=UPI001FBAF226|nr:uncharacterized protein LOC125062464 isoform X2 [Pieris napi]
MLAGLTEKYALMIMATEHSGIQILRNKGSDCAQRLGTALQIFSKTALTHLLQGSNAVASIIECMENYMIEREEIEMSSVQSLIDSTPNTERNYNHNKHVASCMYHKEQVRPSSRRVLQEGNKPLTMIDEDITPHQNTNVEDMGLEEKNGGSSVEEDGANAPRDERSEELSILLEELSIFLEESEEIRTPSILDLLTKSPMLLESPRFDDVSIVSDGSPWSNNKRSRDESSWEKPGPSRNEKEKANSSLENDCVAEVLPHLPSQEIEEGNSHKPLLKYRCQKSDSQTSEDRPEFDASNECTCAVNICRHRKRRTIEDNNSTDTVHEYGEEEPDTRTRRARKPVNYKEDLKCKLRR